MYYMNGPLDNFAAFIYFDPVKQNQTDKMIFRLLSMLIKTGSLQKSIISIKHHKQ